jgi:ankyrin repeat protein
MKSIPSTLLFACCVLGLCARQGVSGDDRPSPNTEQRLLTAIADGRLAVVKKVAPAIDLTKVTNLRDHVLGSPNADLVEYLRQQGKLPISDLQVAAIRGDADDIKKILAKLDKASRIKALAWGYTPLSSYSPLRLAVRNGRVDAARELIRQGADVDEPAHYSLTPLANAAERGNVAMVKLLLKSGAKVNAAPDGYTPLMRACFGGRPKTARLLIDAGADPNLRRHDGQRALHFAAKQGSLACVKLLLKAGADAGALAYEKDTALSYAQLYEHSEIVEVLRGRQSK